MAKKCMHCGTELPDTAISCYKCGGDLAPPMPVYPPPYMAPPQKSDNAALVIVIIVVVVVAITIIGAAVMYVMVTGYTGGGGGTSPPIVALTTESEIDNQHYTIWITGVSSMDNDMSYDNFKIVVYRNGATYSTLWLYDELSWGELSYDDVTGEGDLSTGDTIDVEVDGTSAEWEVEIIWTEGSFSALGDENVVGSQSWST